jgi:hypothetical protein
MADNHELEKNTKYLLFFVVSLLLIGVFFIVRGILGPWLNRIDIVYESPKIQISAEALSSSSLINLNQFYHIDYPEREIGRRNLFEIGRLDSEEES